MFFYDFFVDFFCLFRSRTIFQKNIGSPPRSPSGPLNVVCEVLNITVSLMTSGRNIGYPCTGWAPARTHVGSLVTPCRPFTDTIATPRPKLCEVILKDLVEMQNYLHLVILFPARVMNFGKCDLPVITPITEHARSLNYAPRKLLLYNVPSWENNLTKSSQTWFVASLGEYLQIWFGNLRNFVFFWFYGP